MNEDELLKDDAEEPEEDLIDKKIVPLGVNPLDDAEDIDALVEEEEEAVDEDKFDDENPI
ncbi:MAG: hypothetical protein WD896_02880 [Parcubacteria group bacterium]